MKPYEEFIPREVVLQKGQDQLINLTFEKVVDNAVDTQDFIPIIYQRQKDQKSHFLLMFDIEQMKVVKHIPLISNLGLRENQRTTITGFAEYQLCRTSDVASRKSNFFQTKATDAKF